MNENIENVKFISTKVEENIEFLKKKFAGCSDIIYRKMNIENIKIYIVYIDGLIDKTLLMEEVMEKLLFCKELLHFKENTVENIANEIPITEIEVIEDLVIASKLLINGNILIFIENNTKALSISLNKYSNSDEPIVEPSILGPKESLTKVLKNNTALIRRYLNNEDCKVLNRTLGKEFPKQASIIYLESVVNKNILDEVIRRISRVDLDIIMDISNLAEFIEDNHYSPFPTITITERIDKVVANLIEGKIIVLLDNSSFALVLPSVFIGFFHSPEDYYNRVYLTAFVRFIRFISYLIAIFLPGFYTAITLYNHELIPTKLLLSIATQAIDTPFSSTIQLIFMLFAFELLRELGIRLPKGIGSTVSLVGALIIGETVVRAGLVSTSVVIVTAITAITSMLFPGTQLYESILICRIIILFLGSALGVWGILVGFLCLVSHLSSISSFGIPYTYAVISNNKEVDDIVARAPIWQKNNKKLFKKKNKF